MLEGAGAWAPGGEIEGKGAHAGAFGGGHVWGPSGTGMYSRAPSQLAPPPSFSVPSSSTVLQIIYNHNYFSNHRF